jgi:hypothetical protein
VIGASEQRTKTRKRLPGAEKLYRHENDVNLMIAIDELAEMAVEAVSVNPTVPANAGHFGRCGFGIPG